MGDWQDEFYGKHIHYVKYGVKLDGDVSYTAKPQGNGRDKNWESENGLDALRGSKDYAKWSERGYWFKSDLNRPDVGFKKVNDDIKPDIKETFTEKEFRSEEESLTYEDKSTLNSPGLIDWYSHEPYLRSKLNSENDVTRREAAAKIAKIDYYKNLGL